MRRYALVRALGLTGVGESQGSVQGLGQFEAADWILSRRYSSCPPSDEHWIHMEVFVVVWTN